MSKWEKKFEDFGLTEEDLFRCCALNKQISKDKKELSALKDKIKKVMNTLNLDTISNDEITVTISHRTKKVLNEQLLHAFLDSKGLLQETTETKVVFVKEKLDKIIEEGKITKAQIELCKDCSYTDVFAIKSLLNVNK